MSMNWIITAEEREALRGLPYLARLIYYEALRPFMNYQTGIVGNPPRGISYQSIAEELYVEPVPGRHTGDTGAPSQKAIRNALGLLSDVGLIRLIPAERRLVFELLLALRDESAQKSRGRGRAEEGQTSRGRPKPSSDAGLQVGKGRGRADPDPPSRGTPPYSDLRMSPPLSRACEETALELPDWLPLSDWQAFIAHRQAAKKPLSDDATTRMLKRLETLKGEGHDPSKLLDVAIRNGWLDVYPKDETRRSVETTAAGACASPQPVRGHSNARPQYNGQGRKLTNAEIINMQARQVIAEETRRRNGDDDDEPREVAGERLT